MKKLMFMLLLAGSIQAMYAQKFSPNTPLFEELTDVKKKTDKFNLYATIQRTSDAHFQHGFEKGAAVFGVAEIFDIEIFHHVMDLCIISTVKDQIISHGLAVQHMGKKLRQGTVCRQ